MKPLPARLVAFLAEALSRPCMLNAQSLLRNTVRGHLWDDPSLPNPYIGAFSEDTLQGLLLTHRLFQDNDRLRVLEDNVAAFSGAPYTPSKQEKQDCVRLRFQLLRHIPREMLHFTNNCPVPRDNVRFTHEIPVDGDTTVFTLRALWPDELVVSPGLPMASGDRGVLDPAVGSGNSDRVS